MISGRHDRACDQLRPEPLAEVDEWLDRYRALWKQRLDAPSGRPPDLDDLVVAMLAKSPTDRPDAEAVYDALLPLARSDPRTASDERDPRRPFIRPLAPTPRTGAVPPRAAVDRGAVDRGAVDRSAVDRGAVDR